VQSTPLYDDGTLYVVSGDTEGPDEERRGHILALDASSGEMAWDQVRETPMPLFTRPVMAGGQLLVVLPNGTLQAYDPDNGALVRELAVAPES
jgi:outer membrane protein assembly factor BamB